MNTKVKLSIFSCLFAATLTAHAEDLQTVGSISAMCSFDGNTIVDGVFQPSSELDILSSVPDSQGGYSGSAAASINIANNSPGGFSIIVSTPSAFSASPASYAGSPDFNSSFVLNKASGANNSADLTSGHSGSVTLSSAGSDTLFVRNVVTNDGVYLAGSYTVENTVTCSTL